MVPSIQVVPTTVMPLLSSLLVDSHSPTTLFLFKATVLTSTDDNPNDCRMLFMSFFLKEEAMMSCSGLVASLWTTLVS
eukprot:5482207-Karenia_brevis.AAC.1